MFSKQSAPRFPRQHANPIGPGYYEVPTGLDDRAAIIYGAERWDEHLDTSDSSFAVYIDDAVTEPVKERSRSSSRKSTSLREKCSTPFKENTAGNTKNVSDVIAGDLADAKKSADNASEKLQAKSREVEDMQKRITQLEANNKELEQHLANQEAHLDAAAQKEKLLREKAERFVDKLPGVVTGLVRNALQPFKQKIGADAQATQLKLSRLQEQHERIHELALQDTRRAGELEAELQSTSAEKELLALRLEALGEAAGSTEMQISAEQLVRQATISALSNLYATAEASLSEKCKELDDSNAKLILQSRELETLATQKVRLEAALTEKSIELDTQNAKVIQQSKDLESLAAKEASLGAIMSETSKHIEVQQARLIEQSKELEMRTAQEARLEAHGAELQTLVAGLQGQLFTAEQALACDKKSQAERERQAVADLSAAHARTAEVEKEKAELSQKLAFAMEATCAEEEKLKTQEGELVAMRATCQEHIEEETRLKVQLNECRDCFDASEQALLASRQRQGELEQQIENISSCAQAKDAATQQEMAELRIRINDAQVANASVEQKLASQNEELQNAQKEHQRQMHDMRVEMDSKTLEIQMLSEAEQMLQAEHTRLLDEYAIVAGHANHQQKIKLHLRLKEENIELREEVKKYQEQVLQLLAKQARDE
jgi:hypothetical protein